MNSTKILDGTIATADIASGGNDQVLTTSATGTVQWEAKSNLTSTVTQVVTSGNTIATHNNGTSSVNIIETNTEVAQATGNADADVTSTDARTIATYTSEDGTDTTINESVTSLSQNTTTGVITYNNEAGTNQTANVVAAETDNKLTVGANGGAYFAGPTTVAAGKVSGAGAALKIYGATVTRVNEGDYQVTFTTARADANYVIQLSILDCNGDCPGNTTANYDDPGITYYNQTTTGFRVNIGDSDNGTNQKDDIDLEFMFNVIDF
ncbi:hypothetical protein TXIAM_50151 [Tenacibaculum xiamenense]